MMLYQDCMVDPEELPTSTFATRSLSELKCEVVLTYTVNRPVLFRLMASHNFPRVL
jgi:hypothetical protein